MVFRILVATDNHLGFLEKDPVRGNDSFAAFHEILRVAKQRQVDFVLLGGDLFHDNKPSRKTMHRTITMLRQFCMGDRPCAFDFVSAQDETFRDSFATVNYQDPNYNVSIPVFSIHGNHDDPSGDGDLCALDILAAAGLINYFGRSEAIDDVKISPMLLTKDDVKLAVYGLGNIRDERLYRTFLGKKVRMFRPKEDKDDWFNLFVLHQNRVKRGPTNYVPESFLPDFLHLVVWGHEHDCMIDLEQNEEKGFYITQPGSSVATSLSEGEMIPKHVGILEIYPDKQFKLEKVSLKSVRPFVMDDIILADCNLKRIDEKRVDQVLKKKVEEMIITAHNVWVEANPTLDEEEFPKPLIRLRVDYSDFTTLNPMRFGQKFVDRVANPKDILHFHRKRVVNPLAKKEKERPDFDLPAIIPESLDKIQVEDLVNEFLAAQSLEILPENGIGEAVRLFVEKEDKEAISDFVAESLKKTQESLEKSAPDVINDEINLMKQISKEKQVAVSDISIERAKLLETGESVRKSKIAKVDIENSSQEQSEEEAPPPKKLRKPAVVPKARAAPKSKPASTRASAVGAKRKKPVQSEDDMEEQESVIVSDVEMADENEGEIVKRQNSGTKTPAVKPAARVSRSHSSKLIEKTASASKTRASSSGLRQSTLNFASTSSTTASVKSKRVSASTASKSKGPTVFQGSSEEEEEEPVSFSQFGNKSRR
ncbi:Double-strand break repair protein mre11a [Physocladia obscura]|uniref:Double-strand break repair protein n=1 Tax=Physocladia obscura TaxID=109957 RepID=A0AAD5SVY6_9FUNG|nr:Double-strand break repair protein mre11a [Physocladia obscura]